MKASNAKCIIHGLFDANKYYLSVMKNFPCYQGYGVDAKFTIIEKIEKNVSDEITSILESHEDDWILRLRTLTPNGLNGKINHPENIRL